jgi:hypothetical protein
MKSLNSSDLILISNYIDHLIRAGKIPTDKEMNS